MTDPHLHPHENASRISHCLMCGAMAQPQQLKGLSLSIDAVTALSAEPDTEKASSTPRDVLLCHLSLGAGRHADVNPKRRTTATVRVRT